MKGVGKKKKHVKFPPLFPSIHHGAHLVPCVITPREWLSRCEGLPVETEWGDSSGSQCPRITGA